ncbi:MAG: isopentenyl-diphosphate Delta-isomerase [Gammaproteobacteria bacterium]
MMQSPLILVDHKDNPCGVASKEEAHSRPLLHRAFSILLFRPGGDLILQRRAPGKYHSAGLWSNTCCSHPVTGVVLSSTVNQRLQQEMGLSAELEDIGTLHYELDLGNGLYEHEFNHVFCGVSDQLPLPDPAEVAAWKTLPMREVNDQIAAQPERFSAWFPLILEKLRQPLHNYLQRNGVVSV